MKIKTELEKLKSVDIYSLLMFVLFKVKDVKEYSTMSELCYLLDKIFGVRRLYIAVFKFRGLLRRH